MRGIGSEEIDETVTFDYEIDVGDELQLLFLLNTFAKLKLKGRLNYCSKLIFALGFNRCW